jgi:Protein of unknown function (DUF1501)
MNANQPLFGLSRRDFVKLSAAGVAGVSLSGWMNVLASRAAEAGTKHKSCILLWMDGGPSQKDTFDMKPGTKNAGDFNPIKTAVPGIEISENFPKFAELTKEAAIIRSMSTAEGAHGRARYYMHTGYKEGIGGLVYPSLGAIASAEIGDPQNPVPNFVSIGARSYGSGFLGPKYQPLIVNDAAKGVENLKPLVGDTEFENRLDLLKEMEDAFYHDFQAGSSHAHQTTYDRAVTLMKSKEAKAFDLSLEKAETRDAYGKSKFGDGCLLARRLVETGVSFVEVNLGQWDTHQNNFEKVKELSGIVDPAMSALTTDLKQRGLLDSTLVIWMGEFGRTPTINTRAPKPGRDHFPRAWTSILIGGGIKAGQVIGATDKEGAAVTDKPVSALDFMASVCQLLGITYTKQNNAPNGRPIRIVDKGATPIKELF